MLQQRVNLPRLISEDMGGGVNEETSRNVSLNGTVLRQLLLWARKRVSTATQNSHNRRRFKCNGSISIILPWSPTGSIRSLIIWLLLPNMTKGKYWTFLDIQRRKQRTRRVPVKREHDVLGTTCLLALRENSEQYQLISIPWTVRLLPVGFRGRGAWVIDFNRKKKGDSFSSLLDWEFRGNSEQ